jgi:hypothetical protein
MIPTNIKAAENTNPFKKTHAPANDNSTMAIIFKKKICLV